MAGLRAFLQVIGFLAVVAGLFWVGQGMGWIMWPDSSFMLGHREWAKSGGVLAGFGLLAMLLSRYCR